uniref:Tail protein n=1 Tax=viral metagenome TaxID=1070528 RepID=A0A6M3K8C9_9ZZZZ
MGATHQDGISVYGSGYMVGKKGLETLIIDKSGYVQDGRLVSAEGTTGLRIAAGTTGFSGWVKTAVSTALTSILHARADSMVPQGGIGTLLSGFPCLVKTDFSGHMMDITTYYVGSGATTTTSCGVSSKISWFAIGT